MKNSKDFLQEGSLFSQDYICQSFIVRFQPRSDDPQKIVKNTAFWDYCCIHNHKSHEA